MRISDDRIIFYLVIFCVLTANQNLWSQIPKERGGFIRIEAEAFVSQESDKVRKWYRIYPGNAAWQSDQEIKNRLDSASAGSFIEILPDTRQTHDDTLISGENFSNLPGKMGILNNPGLISKSRKILRLGSCLFHRI